jgi:hypothetical protein
MLIAYYIELHTLATRKSDKGKPSEKLGRKASGLKLRNADRVAGLPGKNEKICTLHFFRSRFFILPIIEGPQETNSSDYGGGMHEKIFGSFAGLFVIRYISECPGCLRV